MGRRLRLWLSLTTHERGTLLLLAVLLPGISLALRLFGYTRTRTWLDRHRNVAGADAGCEDAWQEAQRLAELARIAGRHGPIRATCLRQSLAVYWLLRRRGLQPEMKLGVGRVDGAAPDMHAWVELDGRALAQPGLRHTVFSATAASRHLETAATTSGKRA
jgi:hypothetical protein